MKSPLITKSELEKIILKILYEEKNVKSTNLLIEKVLNKTFKEKITISEKNIKNIIDEMHKEKKIKYRQKEGWTIQI